MSRYASSHKEILFGVIFGMGAALIDVTMHSSMSNRAWLDEFLQPSLVMLLYRVMFLLLGISLGVLLWQRNRVERDSRRWAARFTDLKKNLAGPSIVVHTNLQLLLTRHHVELPNQLLQIVESTYENSKLVQQVLTNASTIEEGTAS